MKAILKILTLTIFLFTVSVAFGQDPPPPPPGGGSGGTGNVPGGGAPTGSGLVILAILGAGYGSKKLFQLNKRKLEECGH